MAEEDVWDDWEDMADSGELDKRLEMEKKLQDEKGLFQHRNHDEDSQRTAYQPQLRILKRQSGSGAQSQANSSDGNSKNKSKTLAEREAEYAEARLRILGSATSEDPDEVNREEPNPPVLMRKSPSKLPDSTT
ncbi:putative SUZ domain-containing protein 1-like isoform X1 [Apostichopus japonicus]|uniref:Putative SUZ domain-containing protein 1-like isoform X1 n=1 Tax=Stichopus japonicus TaxID=307972 RepID=A0A2G8JVF8_STIJA|nr:putative SUZ domain-containing protein 1-like isoform X1 [Apostichopus japonicus]